MEQPEPLSVYLLELIPEAQLPTPKLSGAGTHSLNHRWLPKHSSGLIPGAALPEPSGVAAQRWLSDRLCPVHPHIHVKPSSEMPLIYIRCQTSHKQKQRAAVKPDTENSS